MSPSCRWKEPRFPSGVFSTSWCAPFGFCVLLSQCWISAPRQAGWAQPHPSYSPSIHPCPKCLFLFPALLYVFLLSCLKSFVERSRAYHWKIISSIALLLSAQPPASAALGLHSLLLRTLDSLGIWHQKCCMSWRCHL